MDPELRIDQNYRYNKKFVPLPAHPEPAKRYKVAD